MSKHVTPLSLTFRLFVTFQPLTSHLEMYACLGVTLDRAFARGAAVFEIVYRVFSSEGWILRSAFKTSPSMEKQILLAWLNGVLVSHPRLVLAGRVWFR